MRVAVVGYGNIGRQAVLSVKDAPDMELAGVVRRKPQAPPELRDIAVTDDIRELNADAAILAVPSRKVREYAQKCLSLGINTADSYDIHDSIFELREALDPAAKAGGAAAVISSGWDPGSDSYVRALLEACAPRGITYTDFGPGMSMGHSVAARGLSGVKDALSITVPTGCGVHRRMLYVVPEQGADLAEITALVKKDPYFSHDETVVTAVADLSAMRDMGHGVHMTRKAGSGGTHNQRFEFKMSINNPALTAQVMVGAIRAAARQKPGAYTLIELPVIDLMPGDRESIIRRLV